MAPPPKTIEAPSTYNIRARLAMGWLVGAVALLFYNLLNALRTQIWLWRQRKALPVKFRHNIESFFSAHGVKRIPNVWLINGMNQPFVWGLVRGSIYLPADLLNFQDSKSWASLLGHELSHVVRFDAMVHTLQIFAQVVFWFHPFVWWANRKIRAEREKCCDEMAIVSLHALPEDYSEAIVEALAVKYESIRPVPSLAVAGPVKNIEERIKTMLRPGKKFYKHPSLVAATAILLVALLTVPTSFVLTARAEAAAKSEERATGSLHRAVADADLEQIKLLLTQGTNINAEDEKGRTPLHTATIQGRVDAILLLAAHGADLDVRNRQGRTALYYAASNGSCRSGSRVAVVQHLLALGADPTIADLSDETPLHRAARLSPPGSTSIMAGLIAHGADIDAKNTEGRTAAHVKASISSGADLERLIDLGADLNATDKDGNTVLHLAIAHARPREKESVLACDVNVNHANAEGQTPLHIASRAGNQKIVEGLIAKGARLDVKDRMGQTALHIAAVRGHMDIAAMLVDQGASMNAKTKEDHTPAYLAVRSLNNMVADHLVKKGAEVSNICMASYVGDLPRVREMIAGGIPVNTKDEEGFAPLHAAAAGGRNDVVEYLLAQGAKRQRQVRAGWTALVYAAVGDHLETVEQLRAKGIDAGTGVSELLPNIAKRGYINAAKCLIEFGADVNVNNGAPLRNSTRAGQKDMVELLIAKNADVNMGGRTSLSVAVWVDRPDIAACLIAAGADVDAVGWTPLMEAPYRCKGTEMVELLIKAGADVNKQNRNGWTALHSAAEKREDIATLLLRNGANPNVRSHGHGGRTPLHEAAWFGPNVIKVLVDNGADVNARDDQGYMPLHLAFYYGLRDSVQQLVALGADINARTNSGETILHLAATARRDTSSSASFIEFLLEHGAYLDARDNFEWTPLHRAALLGELEVARVLLTHGADTSSRTNDGKTPSDLAREKGHIGIVELLRKHGAKE
jgi:ankyrin repeat protein/beta-lactamase regulating signal transducer with metallopeptidase domain